MGCIFPMVVFLLLPHGEFGPNGHQEDAPTLLYRVCFIYLLIYLFINVKVRICYNDILQLVKHRLHIIYIEYKSKNF